MVRAVISVIGKDKVGILAKVATSCADHNANVLEVTQSIMQEMFVMTMIVDIENLNVDFTEFEKDIVTLGKEMGMETHLMHEDIFNSMHRI